MREITVSEKYDGKKLNTFLLESFDGLSLNLLYKTLRKKDIRINNKKVSENTIIHAGDSIQIFLPDEQLWKSKNCPISIIYEDNNIVIVNKPVQIEVTGQNSLTSALQSYYQNRQAIYPCHRLDRNTTGLVLFAKNETSLTILLEKFKNHEIEKHYRALVAGVPATKEATLTAYLFKDRKKSLVYISDFPKKGYEKIMTSYQVLHSNIKQNTSLLDVTLHTGKTHQIRAHLAHIGFPIVGDGKYGNQEVNKKLGYKLQQLCSYSLQFHFTTDSGILNYLNEKKFCLNSSFNDCKSKNKNTPKESNFNHR